MDAEAYTDMLPWLVFIVMDRKMGLGVAWAGGGALACSAGLVGWSYWRGRYALLPRIGLGIFAACLVSGLAVPAWNHEVSIPRALVVATLSVLAFGSLRFTPLSETYTVHLVPPASRVDPRFRKVNVQMTLAWGVGSLAVAAACGTTVALTGPVSFTLLDWVTPLVLATATILWAARRWELFRLAVDSVPVGAQQSEAVVAWPEARDALGFSGLPRRVGAVGSPSRGALGSPSRGAVGSPSTPLGLVEPAERESQGAVIRQLPVRRREG